MCAQFPSGVTISDINCTRLPTRSEFRANVIRTVINVTGTSSGADGSIVADLDCSTQCTNITATGTDITPPNGTATFVCQNVDTSQVCSLAVIESLC